jgi:hypothetical protein
MIHTDGRRTVAHHPGTRPVRARAIDSQKVARLADVIADVIERGGVPACGRPHAVNHRRRG